MYLTVFHKLWYKNMYKTNKKCIIRKYKYAKNARLYHEKDKECVEYIAEYGII